MVTAEKAMKAVGMEAFKEGRKTHRLGKDVCGILSSMQQLVSEYIKEQLSINKTRVNNLVENGQTQK